MGKKSKKAAAAVLGAAIIMLFWGAFFSCAGFPPRSGESPLKTPPAGEQGYWTQHPPEGLPPEARRYLDDLAAAFTRGDGAFLLEQGEAAFEAVVRPRYDRETYLAFLYRAGPLVEDDFTGGPLPRLDYRDIKGIEYALWAEDGPAITIRGRFVMRTGAPVPCKLVLLWRLREPKVLGMYP